MVTRTNILITGSKGQLGSSLRKISKNYSHNFIFTDKIILDITNFEMTEQFIKKNKIDIVVNCAALTNLRTAEKNFKLANSINNVSVDNLAKICYENDIQLIHFSTDFVFDGLKNQPYYETDITNPINNYGLSKNLGEQKILEYKLARSIIIRTSWLYSIKENNFFTKILSNLNTKNTFEVVDDEIGSPTNSFDLAKTVLEIIPKLENHNTEIYHYSNLGHCSRYEFACKIKDLVKSPCNILPISKNEKSLRRPSFSALNCDKIVKTFNINIMHWSDSLSKIQIKKSKLFS